MISRAVVVGLLRGNEVLMTQRAADLAWEPNAWHQPGGSVEDGESVHEAAIREVKEEVGAEVFPEDLQFLGIANYLETDGRDVCVYFFATSKWQGKLSIMEADKTQDMGWFPVTSMPDSAPAHSKLIFQNLLRAHYIEMLDGVVTYESSGAL